MKNCYLNPINVPKPPQHTQIKPRCATCKKFEVCSIKEDYLKTALLIQNILGDPQEDRELQFCDCGFTGYDLDNPSNYLNSAITVINPCKTEETIEGTLEAIKYRDKDNLKVLYNIKNYLVMFRITWDSGFSRYTIADGTELYYNIVFKLQSTEIEDTNLQTWRQEMIKKEEEAKKEEKDIINTTHFSAILNCEYYETDKMCNENEGWRKLQEYYNSCGCGPQYHHLATYHIEPHKVSLLNIENATVPVLYPVFVPKKSCKNQQRPPQRRDDI